MRSHISDSRISVVLLKFLLPFGFSFPHTLIFRYHTFSPHSNYITFSKSASLTFSSHVHIDFALIAIFASIRRGSGYRPSEESFTSLTGQSIIMISRCTI